MNNTIFLLPMAVSFLIAVILSIILILLEKKKHFSDERTTSRHIHSGGVSRFGGVAIIVSFVATVLLDKELVISHALLGVILASLAIMFFGIIDDLRQISWEKQLFFQIVLVLAVCLIGVRLEYVTNPFGGILLLDSGLWKFLALFFSVAWIVFLMNAMNWIDGVDGVSGGITSIGAITIFFLSLRPEVDQPPFAIMMAILFGGLFAFLFFNFHPAKIFAGTSGSMFMGFILGVSAIFAGAKIATTMLMLAVPIIDAVWVISERIKEGDSIFSPDKRHLHFKLLEIGWSQEKICFFYYFITAIVAVIALNTGATGKVLAFSLSMIIMVLAYMAIRRKTKRMRKGF